jgi:hypothetical protein
MTDPEIHGEMEHLAHVIPIRNEPQHLPPVSLDDECWGHDFQELYICTRCGAAEERIK